MANHEDFRRIALGMQDTMESAHMGHPDFRAHGRIFATLHDDMQFGMAKLTPLQQERFVNEHPEAFAPEKGAWGRQGCTSVRLDSADEETLGEALTLAWQNSAAAKPADRAKRTPTTKVPGSTRKRRR